MTDTNNAGPANITLADGSTHSADPAARVAQARTVMSQLVAAGKGSTPGVAGQFAGRTDTPQPRDTGAARVSPAATPAAQPRRADGTYSAIAVPTSSVAQRNSVSSTEVASKQHGYDSPLTRAQARGATVDTAYAADVEAEYKQRFPTWTPEQQRSQRAAYERQVADILNGRQRGETHEAFQTRLAQSNIEPSVVAAVDKIVAEKDAATAAAQEAARVWAQADRSGNVPVDKVPVTYLHGYALPPGVTHISREYSENMRAARAAGMSQAAINAAVAQIFQEREAAGRKSAAAAVAALR